MGPRWGGRELESSRSSERRSQGGYESGEQGKEGEKGESSDRTLSERDAMTSSFIRSTVLYLHFAWMDGVWFKVLRGD